LAQIKQALGNSTIGVTLDYSGYGSRVQIAIPPASEVSSLGSLGSLGSSGSSPSSGTP
jgi:hypothetical protein